MSYNIKNHKIQKGFTLVELVIVLVIIGLIISSALVGRDLVAAAQLRATVRQYNEFQVGVNTFISKYNGVPGDILAATATSFGLTGTGGDGDGTIESVTGGAVTTYVGEIPSFWSQLTTSGKELISGSYSGTATCATACVTGVNFPAMKFDAAGWGAYGVTGINYFLAGTTSPTAASATAATRTSNAFTPIGAYNIDAKIDDGMPNTGNVMAGSGIGDDTTVFVSVLAPTTACAAGILVTDIYVYATATNACNLRFLMQTF